MPRYCTTGTSPYEDREREQKRLNLTACLMRLDNRSCPIAATRAIVDGMTIASSNSEPPMWDLLWEMADLPDDQRDEWRKVLDYRTKLPDDAEILAAFGWTPADVRMARWDDMRIGPYKHDDWRNPPNESDPASDGDGGRRRAALMALAEETVRYHDSQAQYARIIRTQYLLDLAQRLPKDQRWSHERIGLVLGLSKQRVQQIIRRVGKNDRRDPPPVGVVPGRPGPAEIVIVTDARRGRLRRIFTAPNRGSRAR